MLCHHRTQCFIHSGLFIFSLHYFFFQVGFGGLWEDVGTASMGEASQVSRLLFQLRSQGRGQGENPLWSWESYR